VALQLDRERMRTFGLFVWRRFVDDKCFETAGALSYTTLFALVPLTAAVFGILSALPAFSGVGARIEQFLFNSFVPAAGRAVQHYLLEFASNARKLTTIGIIVFVFSALAMMANIEERFNRIWRVSARRPPVPRFLVYWAALTLGPLLIVIGLTLTSYLAALPLIGQGDMHSTLTRRLWSVLPFIVTLIGLFAMYMLVPNRPVPWRHAAVGGLLAALLFRFARWAFGTYVSNVPSYEQIYGQLAVIPIFLIWVYLSWVIVLLGASITASLSAFEYRPTDADLPTGAEFLGLLHVIKHLVRMQHHGRGMSGEALLHCEHFMSDDLLERYLDDLQQVKLVRRTDDDEWVMARNLDDVALATLYNVGNYHMPFDRQTLDRMEKELPDTLVAALEGLAQHLDQDMRMSLARAFVPVEHHTCEDKGRVP
jgi:membrane protein